MEAQQRIKIFPNVVHVISMASISISLARWLIAEDEGTKDELKICLEFERLLQN